MMKQLLSLLTLLLYITDGNCLTQSFTNSNLPLLVVQVNGAAINDTPKTPGRLWVVNSPNGGRNALADTVTAELKTRLGIDVRGNTSQNNPKKSYGIELWKANGTSLSSVLLGMPAESDWVLYASYQDKSLMRDPLTYWMARQMGRYSSRARFVELFIDNQYLGVYVLEEKIKRGASRVPITSIATTDVSGDKLTGGYLMKIDAPDGGQRFGSAYTNTCRQAGTVTEFEVEYPKSTNLQPAQFAYIQQYIRDFENALQSPQFKDPTSGYARYADVDSFVDYFLLTELTKNADAYAVSVYFSKDRDSKGGKLTMGPFWDYNYAWGNGFYCGQPGATGWAWSESIVCNVPGSVSFWWERLLRDPAFTAKLSRRYKALRQTAFSNNALMAYVDSSAAVVNEAQVRNFQRWPVLTQDGLPFTPHGGTYAGEVAYLKSWMQTRLNYIDGHIDQIGLVGNAGLTTTVCQPETQYTLLAQAGERTTQQWLYNNNNVPNAQQPTLTVGQSGTYTAQLIYSGNLGCSLLMEPTTITFSNATAPAVTLAYGLTANMQNVPSLNMQASGSAASYAWTGPGQFTAVGTAISRAASPLTDGYYRVVSRSAEGCARTDSLLVDYRSEMADLSLEGQVNIRTPEVGQPVLVSVTVHNDGPADALNVVVQNRLPSRVSMLTGATQVGPGLVQLPPLTVPAGMSETVSYWVRPDTAATVLNALEVVSASRIDPDSRLGSGSGDGEDDVAFVDFRTIDAEGPLRRSPNPNGYPLPALLSNQPPANPAKADLSLQLITSKLVLAVGDTVTVQAVVTNAGGLTATGVSVRVDLPGGFAYVPGSGGTNAGQAVTQALPAVAANRSERLTFKAIRTNVAGRQLIRAEVISANQADPDSQPNSGFIDGQDDTAQVLLR
ncbi:CotH kinase family protein [Fibrella sp. HMF5335]|uniref:CotH kinase family protein n=1 Tax=Fibrella rubiginis TaxID=2817060 RepID=A0A939GBR6_9BACT|nr:CotH kinase family protein [Fibrella rubiginis]MBO0935446.1 CotH kinase family protein [Fibrella rubiginis]